MEKKAISLLQELIRNRCVNDGTMESGFETRSAVSLKKIFNDYGIQSDIFEAIPGRGNIIARIPGTDPHAPSLMYMGHLDVVPANREKWSCDPFSAELMEGYIWGRGAVDMLNIVAASAVGFAEAFKKNGPFPGDLIFLGEADEEVNGRLGARWLVENHWDKLKADYIITEGGGFFMGAGGNIAIASGEKGIASTRLSTKGKSGHGSLPFMADNAAEKIARAVGNIQAYTPVPIITKQYKEIVAGLKLSPKTKKKLLSPRHLPRALKKLYTESTGLAKQLHACSRMTMSPNIVRAGNKINIIPDSGVIELDVRILPGQTVEDVYIEISNALGPLGEEFVIEVIDFFPSNTSSRDTRLYTAIEELVHTDSSRLVPLLFSGVTDARFWRMRGSTVYGISIFDEEMTLTEYSKRLHGADERISVKSMELSVNFFSELPGKLYRTGIK